jgi:GDP-4-dehydro-6-deoxy-D-mannose reductase
VDRAPLVTGGTGFAATHLLRLLLDEHPFVHAWARPGGTPPPAPDRRIRWAAVDLTDRGGVEAALAAAAPSAIYHCAGAADVGAAWNAPLQTLQVNALGTHYLLDGIRAARLEIPVLVTGSALVYRSSLEALAEHSALGPVGPYGVSKLAQEMLALRASTPPVVVTRSFNHAGPGQSEAYVTSSFARQIAQAEAGLRTPVLAVGNLESRRDLTDVRDTVRAYRLLMARGAPGRPYNVCSGRAYRVQDLLDTLLALARVPMRVETDPQRLRPSDNPIVLGDFTRLRQETGWTPAIPIEQTLADLLDDWRRRIARGER